MRIDIQSRWRLHQVDFETGLIGDVRAGKADLGAAGAGAWASVGVTSFRALDAPLLIDSYALQDRVLRSPVIGQMLPGLRPRCRPNAVLELHPAAEVLTAGR
jgi:hypothetical protein